MPFTMTSDFHLIMFEPRFIFGSLVSRISMCFRNNDEASAGMWHFHHL